MRWMGGVGRRRRPGDAIDGLVVGELLEVLQREGRARATALTPSPAPGAHPTLVF